MIECVFTGERDAVPFKEVLSRTLSELLEGDPDVIYLDADLMSCIGMKKYVQDHPSRGVDCGIAEANMVGVACGLAAAGFKPILHSFSPFASRRCYDQIFLSGAYAGNSVTVLGTDPGICAAFNGGTHTALEDMALYRAIPGATVIDITDGAMLSDVLRQLPDRPGVKYLRVGRKTNARVYPEGTHFEIGRGVVLRDGGDAAIFACGIMVEEALRAAEALRADGIEAAVVDLFTVKPLDEELVCRYATRTGAVVTAENHGHTGGLTDAVSRVLASECPVPLEVVAVPERFGEVGPQDYLRVAFDLTEEHIIRKVKRAVERKAAGSRR